MFSVCKKKRKDLTQYQSLRTDRVRNGQIVSLSMMNNVYSFGLKIMSCDRKTKL